MYKAIVRSVISDKQFKSISAFVPDFVILDKKTIDKNKVRALVKLVLNNSPEKVMAAVRKLDFVWGLDYEVIDTKIVLASIIFSGKILGKLLLTFPSCACALQRVHMRNGIITQIVLIDSKACFAKRLKEFKKVNKVLDVIYEELSASELTAKQYVQLKGAYELGYFNFPKKIDVRALARNFGVGPSTFIETLKAAEKKVIKSYFE